MRRAAALLGLVAFAACGSPAPVAPKVEAPQPAPSRPAGPPVRASVRRVDGALRLIPCGSVIAEGASLEGAAGRAIEAAWASLVPGGDGALYVEVRGDELLRARAAGEGPSCETPVFDGDFVIHGNEPFWSVEIRRDGIVYRSPAEPKGRTYPYAATRNEAGKLYYATKRDAPAVSTLEIDLTPGRCVDSMSGEIRAFTARALLDGEALHGCAAAGVPFGEFGDAPLDELARFTGTYEAHGALWRAEPMASRLAALLGPKLPAFTERFQVAGPVKFDGRVYYVTGNMRHRGGLDVAAFVADPEADALFVAIVEDKTRTDFTEPEAAVELPDEVKTFLANLG